MKRKYILSATLVLLTTAVILNACKNEAAPPAPPVSYSWNEEFDTLANSMAKGWAVNNKSNPMGLSSWMQGNMVKIDSN